MTDQTLAQAPLAADGTAAEEAPPAPAPAAKAQPAARALDLLHNVEMVVTVELGRNRMLLRDILSLGPGAVIELDRTTNSPVDVLVNGTLLARGEVVVVEDDLGVRISEVVGTDGEDS